MSKKKKQLAKATAANDRRFVTAFLWVALAFIGTIFVLGYRETQQHRQDLQDARSHDS